MSTAILTDAGVRALSELFPDWRIWAEAETGWHAYRRGGYIQGYEPDSPAFAVHAATAADLAGLMHWQEAIDVYGPFSCTVRPGRDTTPDGDRPPVLDKLGA